MSTVEMYPGAEDTEVLRRDVATGCRIAGHRGLCEDILGHISVRSEDSLLIRCRGPRESGLIFTEITDVRRASYEGGLMEKAAGFSVPNEIHIHTEILKVRSDVQAVFHAHPPAIVALDLAGLELLPVVGAYNIPASRMAAKGIPLYSRSVLVNTPALGAEVAEVLGDSPACVMRGHGLVTVGRTVAEAVSRALSLNSLARMMLRSASAGRVPAALPAQDLAQLPDLGAGFNDAHLWRFETAALRAMGLDLAD
ncbi:MAG: class aldolase/adducin family protein [Nocardioides sp.]|uniref:class II aldolase/adducin family protein n=1 Tax=Nocardioides sp. TaxID=35761 RepID=UPI002612A9AD|nr:class II aldolase/adducin family protein [Nocardioides sp.]MCW2835018.1 class aldolase/adducin family protein [Nocardioides sp.]